jgi:hypothetical protein
MPQRRARVGQRERGADGRERAAVGEQRAQFRLVAPGLVGQVCREAATASFSSDEATAVTTRRSPGWRPARDRSA